MKSGIISYIKYFILAVLGMGIVLLYLYSDIVVGNYKLSYYNFAYESKPWDSENVEITGPQLTDPSDSALPSLYDVFYEKNGFSNEWNSDVALGTPSGTFDKMYPLDFVYFLPFDYAVLIKSILEYAFAFLGMYLLLKTFKLNNWTCALAGLSYCLCSVMVLWAGWPHSDVTAFAPFVIMFTYLVMKNAKLIWVSLLAISIYIFTVAGMPTYAVYFLYLAGFYALYLGIANYVVKKEDRDIKKLFKSWIMFGMAAVIGLMASGPYLYSTMSNISGDYVDSRAGLGTFTIGLKYLRSGIYPYFRNGFVKTISINETTIYAGLLVVILLPFIFVGIKRKKEAIYFNVMAIINFLLVFTHVLDPIFTKMPAINTSLKIRVLVVFIFCTVISVAFNLNDIIENSNEYQKRWYIYIPVLVAYTFMVIYLSSGKLIKVMTKKNGTYWMYEKSIIVSISIVIIVSVLMFVSKKNIFKEFKVYNILLAMLFLVTVWDMAGFAKDYLPLISKDAAGIPSETESIQYLKDNMSDTDRFAAIGDWTLYPNIGEMYGLNDVRAHDFVVKNEDMSTYYNDISSEYTNDELQKIKKQGEEKQSVTNGGSSISGTRARFLEIYKPQLLAYIGTKYILGEKLGDYEVIGENIFDPDKNVVGVFTPGIMIEQNIVAQAEFVGLDIAVANYDHENISENVMIVDLVDEEGNLLEQSRHCFKDIQSNDYITFGFSKSYPKGKYKIRIYTDLETPSEDQVTIWRSNYTVDGFEMTLNGEAYTGTTVMKIIYENQYYDIVKICNDGLMIGELNEYAPKVEIAENVVKCKDEAEVLKNMENEYYAATMYTTADVKETSRDVGRDSVFLYSYDDDEMTIECSLTEDRYVMINDYYDENWKAYVDGKEVKIIKSNYLTRAVLVPKGDTTLTLKYENPTKMKLYYITFASLILCLILIIIDVVLYVRRKNL